jgi:hypothetical protein
VLHPFVRFQVFDLIGGEAFAQNPPVFLEAATSKIDIYSAGVLLFEMVTRSSLIKIPDQCAADDPERCVYGVRGIFSSFYLTKINILDMFQINF